MAHQTIRPKKTSGVAQLYLQLHGAERQAMRALQEAERALLDAQLAASQPEASDEMVESFSRWLPQGRRAIQQARKLLEEATLEKDLFRRTYLERLEEESA